MQYRGDEPAPCRRSAPNSTRSRTSGNSSATTGSPTACSSPTTISSITVAMLGTNSSISRGPSCPSVCEIGHIGSDQRALVLAVVDAIAEEVLPEELPDVLDRVEIASTLTSETIMQSIVPRHDKPAAIRTDLGACVDGLCGARERLVKQAGLCSHVYGLSARCSPPLALMKSADRIPINFRTRCALTPWVVPIPVRPVCHHLSASLHVS